MARFYGSIGVVKTSETAPGVHSQVATEYSCVGEILRSNQRIDRGDKINGNLTLDNRFSIITNSYLDENYPFIKYLLWKGIKWSVNSIEFLRPRIILTIGEVYNG